jgi:hypothetical protein
MRAPVRPIRGRWPAAVERRAQRFCWLDPRVLLDDAAGAEDFRAAMSALHVGDTIKITGTNRHPRTDALLMANVDLTGATIVDIGASDGSTSVELVAKLNEFKAYIMADLFFTLSAAKTPGHVVFYDLSGQPILIAGRRLLAWPSLSKAVQTAYRPVLEKAARVTERQDVLLLNPSARALIARDARVSYRAHDVFTSWDGPQPDVIKVANLLRRLYFSDELISKALHAIHASLPEGGHLLIVDNPRIAGIDERGGLYRKDGHGFTRVALTDQTPEIDDLISQVRSTS